MSNDKMFIPVTQRAAHAYKNVGIQSQIAGASPHELIELLFNGFLGTLSEAKAHLAAGNVPEKSRCISKASRILTEGLQSALDPMGGELSSSLSGLYGYCATRLMVAHLNNDAKPIDEVIELIEPVASSWKSIRNEIGSGAPHV